MGKGKLGAIMQDLRFWEYHKSGKRLNSAPMITLGLATTLNKLHLLATGFFSTKFSLLTKEFANIYLGFQVLTLRMRKENWAASGPVMER